uniref:Expressed protein n=2 Tax=Oryza sativa subsp. japonica TaxID=39947 RepID=Q8W3I0_ORYSJ|nr:hypothetical protein [Oryza sativa Japonica Group]AAP55145.1 expressed protein [Oryza sativa Japonica Group]
MQRLSVGSAGGKPRLLEGGAAAGEEEEEEEKAGKAGRAAPDRSIHIIPVLTLLCFLVLFLLSHDPASSSLAIATGRGNDGVHRPQRRRPPPVKAGAEAGPRPKDGDGAAAAALTAKAKAGCDVSAAQLAVGFVVGIEDPSHFFFFGEEADFDRSG